MIWRHMFEVFDAISPHAIHGWNEKEVGSACTLCTLSSLYVHYALTGPSNVSLT